jgi:hypothetical protein
MLQRAIATTFTCLATFSLILPGIVGNGEMVVRSRKGASPDQSLQVPGDSAQTFTFFSAAQASPLVGDSPELDPAPVTAETQSGRLVWIVVAGLALFIMAVSIIFLLKKRTHPQATRAQDNLPSAPGAVAPHPGSASIQGSIQPAKSLPSLLTDSTTPPVTSQVQHNSGHHEPEASLTNADQLRNGGVPYVHTDDSVANSNSGAQLAFEHSPVNETTRLVPINILDTLIQELSNPESAVRQKAIWELGQRGNSLAVQPLVNAMIDADSHEKGLILAALSEIGSRSLKPMNRALALSLQDHSPEVRKNAIRDLTRIYDQVIQLSQLLGHASQDPDPEVQQTAQWALEQINRIRSSSANFSAEAASQTELPPPNKVPDTPKPPLD